MNPELIPYIRTQLDLGTDKETIRKNLLANGWNEADINTAFASTTSSQAPINIPDKKFAGKVLVLLGLFVGFLPLIVTATVSLLGGDALVAFFFILVTIPIGVITVAFGLSGSSGNESILKKSFRYILFAVNCAGIVFMTWFGITSFFGSMPYTPGISTIATYSCGDSSIDLRLNVHLNQFEGDSVWYSFVHSKDGKENLLYHSNINDPYDGFVPLPVNTDIPVKVFELPSFEKDKYYKQWEHYTPPLINIFIPEETSDNEFNSVASCLATNQERINSDIVGLQSSMPNRTRSDKYLPKRLGGIAHVKERVLEVRNSTISSEFYGVHYPYVKIHDGIIEGTEYLGDLYSGSPIMDLNPIFSEFKNSNGESLYSFISNARKALGITSGYYKASGVDKQTIQ